MKLENRGHGLGWSLVCTMFAVGAHAVFYVLAKLFLSLLFGGRP
jgi:hypothetical protein